MKEYLIYYIIIYCTLRIICTIYLTFERKKFFEIQKLYLYDDDDITSYSFFSFIFLVFLNPFIRTIDNLIYGSEERNINTDYVILEINSKNYTNLTELHPIIATLIYTLTSIPTVSVTILILSFLK